MVTINNHIGYFVKRKKKKLTCDWNPFMVSSCKTHQLQFIFQSSIKNTSRHFETIKGNIFTFGTLLGIGYNIIINDYHNFITF